MEAEECYQRKKELLDLKEKLYGRKPEVFFGVSAQSKPTNSSFEGKLRLEREMPLPPGAESIDGSMIVEQADGTFRPAPGANLAPHLRRMLRAIRLPPRSERGSTSN